MWPHHPVASIFRDMTAEEYAELKDDIREHGIRTPVVLWRGQIVDGRHRGRACEELAVACPSRTIDCEERELPALVWSLNAQRRQDTPGQRAMAAARMATFKNGRPPKTSPPGEVPYPLDTNTRAEVAALAGVGTTTIDRAVRVLRSGDEEVIAKVESAEITINAADAIVRERKAPARVKRDSEVIDVVSPGVRALPKVNITKVRTNALYAIDTQAGILDHYADAPFPDGETCNEWSDLIAKAITRLRKLQRAITSAAGTRPAA